MFKKAFRIFIFLDFLECVSSQSNPLEYVSPTGYPMNSHLAESSAIARQGIHFNK